MMKSHLMFAIVMKLVILPRHSRSVSSSRSLEVRGGNMEQKLLQRENKWIFHLQTLHPAGLNEGLFLLCFVQNVFLDPAHCLLPLSGRGHFYWLPWLSVSLYKDLSICWWWSGDQNVHCSFVVFCLLYFTHFCLCTLHNAIKFLHFLCIWQPPFWSRVQAFLHFLLFVSTFPVSPAADTHCHPERKCFLPSLNLVSHIQNIKSQMEQLHVKQQGMFT